MDMKRIIFTFAEHVLPLLTVLVVVGCSAGAATEDAADLSTGDLVATASRPAASEGDAPSSRLAAGTAELPAGMTDVMVQEGAQIYAGAGICAACHGPDGAGAIGPDLTDAEWLIGDGEFEQLVDQILKGVSADEATNELGAIMPPKGGSAITDVQVTAVAAYIWTLSH
jgi:mono/diheme cytochrome c family protein